MHDLMLLHRCARFARRAVPAVGIALFLSSCTMLPKLGEEPEAPKPAPAPVAAAPVAPPKEAGPPPPREDIKTFMGTGRFVNPKPLPPQPPAGPQEASLNFEQLDVREVAKVILGDYLKESYTVHPAVTGTVTFRTIRPIPLKELLPTLEMLLRQNGAAVVREEGIYKILPIAQVRGSVSPQLGGTAAPLPPGFSVLVVPLKFVGAREMIRLLEPFAADNTVRADEIRNLVILAGHQREMRHLLDTIELFDVDWLSGYSVGVFPIKSADVKSLVTDLDKIFGQAGAGPLAGVVRVIPVERLNALLVVTTQPRYLDMARTWVERLDQLGGTAGGSRFFVYNVRNGRAENLAQLLSELFGSRRATTPTAPTVAPGQRPTEIRSQAFGTTPATPTPPAGATSATFQIPGAGGASSEVRVIADKDTNSLLILSSPTDYELIESALRRLDVIRRQVLVDVTLAEVTLKDDLQFGLNWFIKMRPGRGPNRRTGVLDTGGLPPLPTSPLSEVPFPFGSGLQLIDFSGDEIRAVLNLLGTDNRTQVLSAPQIMVLDNEKAEIKVGSRISVQTQSQTAVGSASNLVSTFQYLETGILLAVTPRINSGGLVTLEINQEVSEPDPASITATNPNPNVTSRNAKTSVVVASGESVVLGGMIRENNSKSGEGLPLISKIPVIGGLFGNQRVVKDRTELVLIVTPKIVSDTSQAREVTDELRKKLPALQDLLPRAQ